MKRIDYLGVSNASTRISSSTSLLSRVVCRDDKSVSIFLVLVFRLVAHHKNSTYLSYIFAKIKTDNKQISKIHEYTSRL